MQNIYIRMHAILPCPYLGVSLEKRTVALFQYTKNGTMAPSQYPWAYYKIMIMMPQRAGVSWHVQP
jgi:hypothetical protein